MKKLFFSPSKTLKGGKRKKQNKCRTARKMAKKNKTKRKCRYKKKYKSRTAKRKYRYKKKSMHHMKGGA